MSLIVLASGQADRENHLIADTVGWISDASRGAFNGGGNPTTAAERCPLPAGTGIRDQ